MSDGDKMRFLEEAKFHVDAAWDALLATLNNLARARGQPEPALTILVTFISETGYAESTVALSDLSRAAYQNVLQSMADDHDFGEEADGG